MKIIHQVELNNHRRIEPAVANGDSRPLYVDLDGTLLATDMLWESLLLLLKQRPFTCLYLPLWLLKGKANIKRQIANRVTFNPASLPYRKNVLSWLRQERASGRELVLATAADEKIVAPIAQHLDLFVNVLASDGRVNLSGLRKLHAIKQYAGERGFDYAGDAEVDLPVWQAAHQAILVHPSAQLLRQAQQLTQVSQIFPAEDAAWRMFIKALRVHQWVKNLLLFVPLVMAHKIGEIGLLLNLVFAFLAYSLCASSVYIWNDLLDLESDRLHPHKCKRPFASGRLSIKAGVVIAPLLLLISFTLTVFTLPAFFCTALALYLAVTTTYSLYLKRIMIIDVFVLAGLYAFRVLAGGIAVNVSLSPWLLSFSVFFFLSLALAKRYSELRLLQANQLHNKGRGYIALDAAPLLSLGPTSGYLSVLILSLYTNSREVTMLYSDPAALWLIGPCLLYWITRIWLLAHRGKMDDDPILFAIRDPVSYAIGTLILSIMLFATFFKATNLLFLP